MRGRKSASSERPPWIVSKKILSRNVLPTIPFQITLLTTIKISHILIFPKTFKTCSCQSRIIHIRSTVSHISSPFIYWYYFFSFQSLITFFHSESVFSKDKYSVTICLTPESDTILFAAEVNICKIISENFLGAFKILVHDSDLFTDSPSLFQTFKAAEGHSALVWLSNSSRLCRWPIPRNWSRHMLIPLALF